MPCIVNKPSVSQVEWLEHMLCQACRFLTKEQIDTIRGADIYQDLWMWYPEHLMQDAMYYKNEYLKEKHEKEHFRIGLGQLEILFEQEKKERQKTELERIRQELEKMGWFLNLEENSIQTKQGNQQ